MEVMQTPGSSNLSEIRYDKESDTLEVDFLSGSTYRYDGVPPSVWRAFTLSPSKGSYLRRSIVPRFPGEQI
jgi:hypothetical protein